MKRVQSCSHCGGNHEAGAVYTVGLTEAGYTVGVTMGKSLWGNEAGANLFTLWGSP